MALISKIRKNSWLLIVLIGLGLGGFIIMDMTSGQQSVFGSSQLTVGEIDGQKLDWNQFNRVEQVLYGNSGGEVFSRRKQLWDYFVEEAIVQDEAKALGLGVSKSELMDLQFGANPSPVIRQRFTDPNTRQVNFQQLNQIKTAIENGTFSDPQMRAFWSHQEKEIIKERLQSKLNAMVTKAIYTPTWMAEMGYQDQNVSLDMAYVKVPFDEIDNTEITLSDADYKNYLEQNKARYRQEEETRKLEYTVFNVLPTVTDSAKLREKIVSLIPDFEAAENDSAFVERNYGSINGFYLSKDELSPAVADTALSIPVGSVYGPYVEQGSYKAMKVLARATLADSADTRHILISADTPQKFTAAEKTIDSLENLLLTGVATFDSLAIKFSQDPGSASKGGKYENVTPNQFVPQYNEVLFITGQVGQLYKVRSDFGWHLIEVLSRSASSTERVKVAFIEERIVPSEDTQNDVYERALAFVGKNRSLKEMAQSVEAEGLELETSTGLKKNDFTVGALGAGQASRDIVRWAFNASEGDVSPEIYGFQDPVDYYTNKYVVAGLKSVQAAGLPSVDNIKDEIEQLVINEKKGEMIVQRIQGDNLEAIAGNFSTQVDTARNVIFNASFLPNLGSEPKVIGKAFTMEEGQVSKPVIGKSGVFVIKVMRKPQAGQATNIPQLRRSIAAPVRSQVPGQLIQAMKKNAAIEDNRSRFY
ncbi:MAG: peptidylprolyl isomerase [Lewinellaceae bacterium]|nr:peptidylprolyl isomerase [Phaeodactylibacter sp.]MCB0612216.1 peptidylprolyl isomerase [Phaeodactylibacter sp.]MCB9347668.1 peptidylprolyl isomerase [Lewinellaceae bacterium]